VVVAVLALRGLGLELVRAAVWSLLLHLRAETALVCLLLYCLLLVLLRQQ
jgi:hypothetical protein